MEEGDIMYSRPIAIRILKKNPNGSYVIEYINSKKKEILTEIELFRKFQPRMSWQKGCSMIYFQYSKERSDYYVVCIVSYYRPYFILLFYWR